MRAMTDSELVRRTLSGESAAFGELIRRHQGAVQGLAYHMTGSFADAQDMAQEAFVRAYLKLEQLQHPERLSAWLRQLTLNYCRSWLRKRRETTPLEEVEPALCDPGDSPAEALERAETRRLVRGALDQLTERNRLVLVLRYLGGLSYRDIARFLDVPLRTVEGRMHRAKQQLKGHVMTRLENALGEAFGRLFAAGAGHRHGEGEGGSQRLGERGFHPLMPGGAGRGGRAG
jgi:RNA polymerase sigma-70 factor, ECF subfamily